MVDEPTKAELDRSFLDLRQIIGFESAQLLRFGAAGAVDEVFRFGYLKDTAWALANLFPRAYETGFTARASSDAPLPATISTSNENFHDEFVTSAIYRDHLLPEGYLDGMSVELSTGGRAIGLAHFSSRVHNAFAGDVRQAMLSMSGMLAHVVAHYTGLSGLPPTQAPAGAAGWYDVAKSMWITSLAERFSNMQSQNEFRRHVVEFAGLEVESLTHLWIVGKTTVEVRLRRVPGSALVSVLVCAVPPDAYFRLTAQELQILSCLCCGLADADIAERLHLSPRTVHAHMGSLRQKMDAANRVELAIIALSSGRYFPHPTFSPIGSILPRRKV
jgi:DNA-binding CsgD family transcriptional regulator